MLRSAHAERDAGGSPKRRLTTIVAADICGYSRIAETDPEGAARLVEVLYDAFQGAVGKHRGRIFNRAGDCFLAEFPSPPAGMACAADFVDVVRSQDAISPNGVKASVRLGVHVGEVLDQANGDLLGPGVNVASRLQGEARPNGVLISLHAFNHVASRFTDRIEFRRRGPLALKSIDEAVVAFDARPGRSRPGRALASLIATPYALLRRALTTALLIAFLGANLAAATIILLDNSEARHGPGAFASTVDYARIGADPRDERTSLISIAELSKSLGDSPLPGKRAVGERLLREPLSTSLEALKEIYDEQIRAEVRQSELHLTLREIGALAYYADTKEATRVYEKLIASYPDDPMVNYQLGELYNQRQRIAEANRLFERARATSRPHQQTYVAATLGLGRTRLQTGRLEDAQAFLEEGHGLARAHQYVNENALAKLKIAAALLISNRKRTASADFAQAKNHIDSARSHATEYGLDVFEAEALNLRGVAALLEARSPAAAGPNRDALLAQARMLLTQAAKSSEAISDQRGLASALSNLGEAHLEGGDWRRAAAALERAFAISAEADLPTLKAIARFHHARVLLRAGDNDAACAMLAEALALFERTPQETPAAGRLAEFAGVCPAA